MDNALSIDLEYWWCNEFMHGFLPDRKREFLSESLNPILQLLEDKRTLATFFILGEVAEKHPEIVEKIYEKGHEIACHSYSHTPLQKLGREEFERELKKTTSLLEKYHPVGFRAPSFSLDNGTRWALELLIKYGYKYDSSIFPVKTMLYGVPDAPIHIYRPSLNDVSRIDPDSKIIEFPLTVVSFIKNIPVSGGFYLRALPYSFLKTSIRHTNKQRPAVVYIHPWETTRVTPRLNMPMFSKFVTYYGTGGAFKKLELLLKDFKFKPMREVLNEV